MIRVVNKKTHKANHKGIDYYIGRGSALGNKFTWLPPSVIKMAYRSNTEFVSNREESISKYKEWLLNQLKHNNKPVTQAIWDIKLAYQHNMDINLVCFCKPLACHGDIIKELIESQQI